jgi:hypothetical protein
MKRIAVMVHGMWNVDGGVATIGKLRPELEETHHQVEQFSYPYIGLLGTRTRNDDHALELCDFIKKLDPKLGDSVSLYCHSNGCTITHLAMKLPLIRKLVREEGVKFNLIYINAALNRKLPFPKTANQVRVFYSRDDIVVKLAHIWRVFLTFLHLESRWRPWGDMGRYGYRGKEQPHIRNNSLRMFLLGYKGKIGHTGCFDFPACRRAIARSVHTTPVKNIKLTF